MDDEMCSDAAINESLAIVHTGNKRWSKAYFDKIKDLPKLTNLLEEATEKPTSDAILKDFLGDSRCQVKSSVLASVRDHFIAAGNSCKKTLGSLKPPTTSKQWDARWRENNVVCIYCEYPVLHDMLRCQYCMAIIHKTCYIEQKQQQELYSNGKYCDNSFNSEDESQLSDQESACFNDENSSLGMCSVEHGRSCLAPEHLYAEELKLSCTRVFTCPDCVQSMAADMTRFEQQYERLREERSRQILGRTIRKAGLNYAKKKIVIRKKAVVVLLQSYIRRTIGRQAFMNWRKSLFRVVMVQLSQIASFLLFPPPPPPAPKRRTGSLATNQTDNAEKVNVYSAPDVSGLLTLVQGNKKAMLTVTVVDQIKLEQIFRTDMLLQDALSHLVLLIPGIKLQVSTLIFTIYVRVPGDIASLLPSEYLISTPKHSSIHTAQSGKSSNMDDDSAHEALGMRFVPILQAQSTLRYYTNKFDQHHFPLRFSEQMMWLPRDVRGDGSSVPISLNTTKNTVGSIISKNCKSEWNPYYRSKTAARSNNGGILPLLSPKSPSIENTTSSVASAGGNFESCALTLSKKLFSRKMQPSAPTVTSSTSIRNMNGNRGDGFRSGVYNPPGGSGKTRRMNNKPASANVSPVNSPLPSVRTGRESVSPDDENVSAPLIKLRVPIRQGSSMDFILDMAEDFMEQEKNLEKYKEQHKSTDTFVPSTEEKPAVDPSDVIGSEFDRYVPSPYSKPKSSGKKDGNVSLTPSSSAGKQKYKKDTELEQKSLANSSSCFDVVMNFIPLNPVAGGVCCVIYGPRLDFMKRKAEYFAKYSNVVAEMAKEKRGWKWWGCLCEGKLYFYQYYGDMNPRFVSDVSEAVLEYIPTTSNKEERTMCLKHEDGRQWKLGFVTAYEAFQFKYALQQMQLALQGCKSIILKNGIGFHTGLNGIPMPPNAPEVYIPPSYVSPQQTLPPMSFGHDCLVDYEKVGSDRICPYIPYKGMNSQCDSAID